MKSKIKKISIILFTLLIFTGALVFIFRKKIIEHIIPEVIQAGEIHIKIINDTSFINTRLIIKNKTFLKINIDTIKYQVSLFNKTYMQSQKFLGIVLPGYGNDSIDLDLKIPYAIILKEIKSQRKTEDSANYSINVSLQYSTSFWKSEMPINKSGKIKIPEPPEIKIEDIKWKKIRAKSILADVKIKIINHTNITLLMEDVNYSLNISNRGKLKGNYKNPTKIKPKGVTYITIPITIHTKNIGKTVFDVIINRDKYDYSLTLKATVKSTNPQQKYFSLDITKSGKMELRK